MPLIDTCAVDGGPSQNFQPNCQRYLEYAAFSHGQRKQYKSKGRHHGVAERGLRMEGYEVVSDGFLLVKFALFVSSSIS